MGEAKRSAHARAQRMAFRQQVPRRLFKAVVNVLLIVPAAIVVLFLQGYKDDKFIWE